MAGSTRTAWKRLRKFLEPPRRLRVLRSGYVLIAGIFGLSFATLNTGNNVLYLLLGALLGLIALSGWLSEQSLQKNRITRLLPASITAGHTARIEYRAFNGKKILPTVSLELREADVLRGSFGVGFIALIEPGEQGSAAAEVRFSRRGIYRLQRVIAATSYPFGLFAKERDLQVDGVLTVWPRTDRPVRMPRPAGRRGSRTAAGGGAAVGAERGDFRALRPYRPGDDPRDVHWRSTARRGEPIMREYDRDAAESYWIVLDLVAAEDIVFEIAVELTAALAARAADAGERVGCMIGDIRIPATGDRTAVDAALDALARIERKDTGSITLPAQPSECVVVTARDVSADSYADVFRATAETSL
ncbi:MAG: DUF58 domain-containing protein [Longimicrobiales bacterium]